MQEFTFLLVFNLKVFYRAHKKYKSLEITDPKLLKAQK